MNTQVDEQVSALVRVRECLPPVHSTMYVPFHAMIDAQLDVLTSRSSKAAALDRYSLTGNSWLLTVAYHAAAWLAGETELPPTSWWATPCD